MPKYKLQEVDRTCLEMAYERIERAFELFDSVTVSFSGGKDSTAVLNLVADVAKAKNRLPVHAVFFDEEAIPYQTEDYMRRIDERNDVSLRWLCLPVKHRNGCSPKEPFWYPYDPDCPEKWVRPLPPEGITEMKGFITQPKEKRVDIPTCNQLLWDPQTYGRVGMTMGIRTQESITRYRACCMKKEENYINYIPKTNVAKVYPIFDWKTEDVWTAPAQFGWDYNRGYDVMEMAGVPHWWQRMAPPFGEEPMNGLWQFRLCFPEIWDKMQFRVAGASTAALYSRTELYASGSRTPKPDNIPWKEFITKYLEKWPDSVRHKVAQRIEFEIKNHYRKTSDPILQPPHPETGVGWDFLLMLATRGDFKERKSPLTPRILYTPEKALAEYDRALQQYLHTKEA